MINGLKKILGVRHSGAAGKVILPARGAERIPGRNVVLRTGQYCATSVARVCPLGGSQSPGEFSIPAFAGMTALAFLLFCGTSPGYAQKVNPNAGTSSADFLKIGVGARPIAMGETFTAIADDANALYWNPAGLAGQRYANIGLSHDESFQGLRHEFLGYAQPMPRSSSGAVWGFSGISLIVPSDLERRSGLNENDPFNPISSPEGKFGAYDLSLAASYGQYWNDHNAVGATVKYIRQSIDTRSAQTGAVDLGWRSRSDGPWSVGAVMQNFGPGVRFGNQYPLPLTFRLGSAYTVYAKSHLAVELSMPRDDYPTVAFGSEFALGGFFFLRGGYSYRWYGNPLGNMSGLRTGLGFAFQSFSMDYAFVPFGDLGNEHRISVGWRFGATSQAAPAAVGIQNANSTAAEPAAGPAVVPPGAAPQTERAAEVFASTAAAAQSSPVAALSSPAPVPATAPSQVSAEPASDDFTPFRVVAAPKVVSARGTDYLIQAKAPSEDWMLRKAEYRSLLPTTEGLIFRVREIDSPQPLPGGLAPEKVYKISVPGMLAARSVSLEFSADNGSRLAVFGMIDGKWKPLTAKKIQSGGETFYRASSIILPEVIAVAVSPASPNPSR